MHLVGFIIEIFYYKKNEVLCTFLHKFVSVISKYLPGQKNVPNKNCRNNEGLDPTTNIYIYIYFFFASLKVFKIFKQKGRNASELCYS